MRQCDIIEAITALVATPELWVKDTCARDRNGYVVSSFSRDAKAFSLDAAINKVMRDHHIPRDEEFAIRKIILDILVKRKFSTVTDFNDSSRTTHNDILTVMNDALSEVWPNHI